MDTILAGRGHSLTWWFDATGHICAYMHSMKLLMPLSGRLGLMFFSCKKIFYSM